MSEKKKPLILLLSDDMRLHSGIAFMSKEIVLHTKLTNMIGYK